MHNAPEELSDNTRYNIVLNPDVATKAYGGGSGRRLTATVAHALPAPVHTSAGCAALALALHMPCGLQMLRIQTQE
jgi:hypothetical protein